MHLTGTKLPARPKATLLLQRVVKARIGEGGLGVDGGIARVLEREKKWRELGGLSEGREGGFRW